MTPALASTSVAVAFAAAATLVAVSGDSGAAVDAFRAIELCEKEVLRRGGAVEAPLWTVRQVNARAIVTSRYLETGPAGARQMNMRCLADGGGLIEAIAVEAIGR